MRSGDGLLVRVKPPLGRLSAEAAREVAAAAQRHGNGTVELTARGSLQLRGLSEAGLAPVAAAMVAAGLALADPAAERVRGVLCPPLAGADPTVAAGTLAIAEALEATLAGTPALRRLPGKVLLAVEGGGALPLGRVGADLTLRLEGADAVLLVDGSDGGLEARCAAGEAVDAVLAVLLAWVSLAGEVVPRLRHLPAAAVFARAGLGWAAPARSDGREEAVPAALPGGVGAVPCGAGFAVGLGLAFGQGDAEGLRRLAGLAERHGDGVLRLSPWRAVLLAGVAPGGVAALQAGAAAAGLIVGRGDARLGFVACPGRPDCLQGTVPARADAALLARALGRMGGRVHVSGCAKGCAHPGASAITLVGADGRYDLVRDGAAGDRPSATGLSLAEAAALLQGTL